MASSPGALRRVWRDYCWLLVFLVLFSPYILSKVFDETVAATAGTVLGVLLVVLLLGSWIRDVISEVRSGKWSKWKGVLAIIGFLAGSAAFGVALYVACTVTAAIWGITSEWGKVGTFSGWFIALVLTINACRKIARALLRIPRRIENKVVSMMAEAMALVQRGDKGHRLGRE
jgi:hypothetical protein